MLLKKQAYEAKEKIVSPVKVKTCPIAECKLVTGQGH
jgi:hypothetical protein